MRAKFSTLVKVLGFAFVVCFAFWRVRYGFASTDETYAIAFPYRLCFGDALIADEWGLQQFAGLIVYPFVSLYLRMFHSTEGIVLAFRYLFVSVMVAAGLFQYSRWRRVSRFGAYLGLLFFVAYAPFGIMTLAYNNMDVIFGALTITLYGTYDRRRFWPLFFAGMTFSATVMCCPQLLLGYGAYTIYALIASDRRKEWVLITSGACVVGVVVLAFVFSRATLQDVIAALPLMLEDPEHPQHGIAFLCCRWFKCAIAQQGAWSALCYGVTGCGFLWLVIKRVRTGIVHSQLAHSFFSIMLLVGLALAVFKTRSPNSDYLLFPTCTMLFFLAWFVAEPELRHGIFRALIPAYVLGFCTLLGCNTGHVRISIVMACVIVPALAYWMRVYQLQITSQHNRIVKSIPIVLFALVCANVYFRYCYVFSEVPISRMDTWVMQGPEKGVKTIAHRNAQYERLLETLRQILPKDEMDTVCFVHANTTAYLAAQRRYGAYTAWVTGSGHASFARLKKYYDLHPDRMPGIVLFSREDSDQHEDFRSIGFRDGKPVPYGSFMTSVANGEFCL